MNGVPGWVDPLLAFCSIVLPLVLAWWWVAREARKHPRRKRRTRDNAAHRRDLP